MATRTIELKDLPVRVIRELTKRAEARRMTVPEYIEDILERECALPPTSENIRPRPRRRSPDAGAAAES